MRLSDLGTLPVADIDLLALKAAGLVPAAAKKAKVIKTRQARQGGEAHRACSATKGAKAAIEAAGGSVRAEAGAAKLRDSRETDNALATANPALKSGNKYGDLKRRLWFLLGALIVYRIGTHIPVPGINASVLDELFRSQQGGILGLFNVFSGGALSRFSIFALGIMPYISASIIMQLCTVVVPSLEALKKEGEVGPAQDHAVHALRDARPRVLPGARASRSRSKRRPGLVIEPGLSFRIVSAITLVTGTMFLMWLGEQITERGLGNGISLIIFAGIAAGLPHAIGQTLEQGAHGRVLVAAGASASRRWWSR